jgi:hypothetical protein
METVGNRIAVDDKNAFRLHVYNPVMDSIIGELDKRFSDSNCLVMKGIQCLCPTDENFAQIACIKPFAEMYGSDIDDLAHELHQAKRLLERSAQDTNFIKPSHFFHSCLSLHHLRKPSMNCIDCARLLSRCQ